jgi:hypothetical protein
MIFLSAAASTIRNRSSCSRAADVEHRVVGKRLDLNERWTALMSMANLPAVASTESGAPAALRSLFRPA